MEKVLFFVDRMRVGGIQVLLMNLQEHFNSDLIQCEYLVLDDGENYPYEQKFIDAGAKLYKLKGVWLDSIHGYIKYGHAMDDFFKQHHDYIAVHMNASSKNFMLLYYAKKYGIEKRIVHSHSTDFRTKKPIKKIAGDIFKIPMKKYATDFFACSSIAGEWLFGKKMISENKVYIMPNAIDLDKFEYDNNIRLRVRHELGISDEQLVVGHVGRFAPEKNHRFLIAIFSELHRIDKSAVLIMAGTGELMEDTKKLVEDRHLKDCVMFLGFRDDINDLTQAMDVFVMPSFYEGFPVTGIEAQASGCPCIFSDTITREAALLGETIYVSLNDSPKKWAELIPQVTIPSADRSKSKKILIKKGFDINDMTGKLEKIYLSSGSMVK